MLTPAATDNSLDVAGLRKVFHVRGSVLEAPRSIVAVDDVSFAVPAQRSFGIIGESGSGKTTIARILLGLETPTGGSIRFFGEPYVRERSAAARLLHARRIQMVFQDPYSSLDPNQKIGKGLEELLALYGFEAASIRARRRGLLEQVGISPRLADVLPRQLSGGQRQRVAIARALAAQPRIILLDEAVASLDVSIQAQILNTLADIREEAGVQYILISHNLAVVRQLTDDCIVMHRGAIVESGPTEEVLSNPKHPYTIRLRESIPRPPIPRDEN